MARAMSAQPTYSENRIVALDALRGLAVMGIILMNVYVFAMPQQAYLNPVAWGEGSWSDLAVWGFSFVFIEDKFRSLFAMLFGAGVFMILSRDGSGKLAIHFRRMAVLFVIGVVHAVTLANNDILRGYALAGLLLPLFIRFSERWLVAAAALLLTVHLVGGYAIIGGIASYVEQVQGQSPSDPEVALLAAQNYGSDPAAIAGSIQRGQEEWADRVSRRVERIPATTGFVMASIPLNLAAMLIGIALWKSGLLSAQWSTQRLRAWGLRMMVLSLPVLLLLAWIAVTSEFAPLVMGANGLFLSEPFDLLLGAGYAALAMAGFQSLHPKGAFMSRIAAAGRLSLTNYVMTSVVLAFLFASWGLGWFATIDRLQALAMTLIPIGLILAWSKPWLAYHRYGPMEWMWRTASMGQTSAFRETSK